eukprot:Em0009g503a
MEANVPAEGLKLASSRGRPREEASFRPCAGTLVSICFARTVALALVVTIPCDPSGATGPEELVARRGHWLYILGTKQKTSECFGHTIFLHGFGFDTLCSSSIQPPPSPPHPTPPTTTPSQQLQRPLADTVVLCMGHVRLSYRIMVGNREYRDPVVVCTLERGTGQGLAVFIVEAGDGRRLVAVMEDALFFKEAIDFRAKFDKVVELGVGGSKKEINELYRRAFASRGTSPIALRQLGIGHVKVRVMDGDVQLINGPEIVSKYLGESERNLRTYFKDTQGAWQQSGAAYDALVIQLLTLMDGLNNLLVVQIEVVCLMKREGRRFLRSTLDPWQPVACLDPMSITVPPSDCKAYFSMDPEREWKDILLGSAWKVFPCEGRSSSSGIRGCLQVSGSNPTANSPEA